MIIKLTNVFKSKENVGIFLLYIFSTSWFIYQHTITLSWDFSAYVLNAKYLFNKGYYFEPLRPPLVPFIIGVVALFAGWRLAEYIYIIIVSTLFLFASCKLAESLNFKKFYFYLISLNIYTLKFGLINGSELLSLALLEFFISGLIKNKISGHWLNLASLTRYEFLIFTPLLIFHRKPTRVIINFLLFLIPWLPWFSFNFLKYGNVFTSIGDSYAINMVYKASYFQPFKFSHILDAVNFLLPFAFVGIIFAIYSMVRSIQKKVKIDLFFDRKVEISMLFILIFTLYFYSNIPVKNSRYLFTLTLPIFYFSYITIEALGKKFHKFIQPALFILLLSLSLGSLFLYFSYLSSNYRQLANIFVSSIEKLKSLNLSNCSVMSNGWVLINYFGQPSKPNPWEQLVEYYLNNGEVILLFHNIDEINEPEYARNVSFLIQHPIIYKNDNFLILKRKDIPCRKIEVFDEPYLHQLNTTIYKIYNETINIEYCDILFKNKILSKLCRILNFNFQSS